jgi:TetR/AcrR family transcriptional regulator of autoinduction and epiphytic fitness
VLFDVVIAHGWSRLLPGAEQPPERNATVDKRLRLFARRRIDVLIEPGIVALFRMVLAESVRAPELMRAYASPRGLGELLGLPEILQEEVRRGRLRIEHIELAATQFWGLTLGSLFWPLVMGMRGTPDETEREIVVGEAIRVFLARYGKRRK